MKMFIPIDPEAEREIECGLPIERVSAICEEGLVAFFLIDRIPGVAFMNNGMNKYRLVGTPNNVTAVVARMYGADDPVVIQDDGSGNQVTASGRVLR